MEVEQSSSHEPKEIAQQAAAQHFTEADQTSIVTALNGEVRIVAWHLYELCPPEVPYRHTCELTVNNHIYSALRRLPEKMNTIVQEEIDLMLRVKVIKPENSPWGFSSHQTEEGRISEVLRRLSCS